MGSLVTISTEEQIQGLNCDEKQQMHLEGGAADIYDEAGHREPEQQRHCADEATPHLGGKSYLPFRVGWMVF